MKCTNCGEESHIAFVSVLDGNICKGCYDELFYKNKDGSSSPKNYNKDKLSEIVNNLDYESRQTFYKAIKDIHSRYRSKIIYGCKADDHAYVMFESRFNKKNSLIALSVGLKDKDSCYRVITLEDGQPVIKLVRAV